MLIKTWRFSTILRKPRQPPPNRSFERTAGSRASYGALFLTACVVFARRRSIPAFGSLS
jgi:hypothetical protein